MMFGVRQRRRRLALDVKSALGNRQLAIPDSLRTCLSQWLQFKDSNVEKCDMLAKQIQHELKQLPQPLDPVLQSFYDRSAPSRLAGIFKWDNLLRAIKTRFLGSWSIALNKGLKQKNEFGLKDAPIQEKLYTFYQTSIRGPFFELWPHLWDLLTKVGFFRIFHF